jgi:hypothetical protein
LPAPAIARALGYQSVRTNSFSARLSSARQFGLVTLRSKACSTTALAQAILKTTEPRAQQRSYQEALRQPPLYAALIEQLAGKRLPEADVLAEVIARHYPVTAAGKRAAALAFLASVRFAGAVSDGGVLQLGSETAGIEPPVQIELPLWGRDLGKTIALRVPASISGASFERLLQALRVHVRIEEERSATEGEAADAGPRPPLDAPPAIP